jgi:hypothetical protein
MCLNESKMRCEKREREREREREAVRICVHDTDVLLDSIGTRGSSSFKMIKSDICDCAVCVNMLSFMFLSSDQLIYYYHHFMLQIFQFSTKIKKEKRVLLPPTRSLAADRQVNSLPIYRIACLVHFIFLSLLWSSLRKEL